MQESKAHQYPPPPPPWESLRAVVKYTIFQSFVCRVPFQMENPGGYHLSHCSTFHTGPVATTFHTAPVATTFHTAPVATTFHTAPVATTFHTASGYHLSHSASGYHLSHSASGYHLSHRASGYHLSHSASGYHLSHSSTLVATTFRTAPGQLFRDATDIYVTNHTLQRPPGFSLNDQGRILPHFDTRTTKDVYIRHYYSEFLTLLVVDLKSLRSLRCALYILKFLNITFRMICSLGHAKHCIALLNFLLTLASSPDARAGKRFSAEEVIAEELYCMH